MCKLGRRTRNFEEKLGSMTQRCSVPRTANIGYEEAGHDRVDNKMAGEALDITNDGDIFDKEIRR